MKDTRRVNRQRKIDPRSDRDDAGHPLSMRAGSGEQNGRISIPASLSGIDHSALGTSNRPSAACALVLDELYGALGQAVRRPQACPQGDRGGL